MAPDDAAVHPFRIDVADEVLDDLRRRLAQTRWPEAELVDDWSQGAPLAWIQDMCNYWADGYDWREREAPLNRFDQFTPRSTGSTSTSSTNARRTPTAKPLVITHGWPGSIVEFHKVIEPLTDPTAARRAGVGRVPRDLPDTARLRILRQTDRRPDGASSGSPTRGPTLMARLGYDRYFAQGGDWGSAVTRSIGAQDADHCAAIHVTLAMGTRPRLDGEPKPDEQRAMKGAEYYQTWDSGYSKQQATRPQTLGYGLADSPAGQAAWILEKFWAWTDCDGHPENVLESRRVARQRDAVLGDQQRDELGAYLLGELRQGVAPCNCRFRWAWRCIRKRSSLPCARGWRPTIPTSFTGPSSQRAATSPRSSSPSCSSPTSERASGSFAD